MFSDKSRDSGESKRNHEKKSVLAGYLTRAELALDLGLNVRTLERWAHLRSGPKRTLVGNRVYYHRRAVEHWLESRTGETA